MPGIWPSRVATDSDLYIAVNGLTTVLTVDLTSIATTVQVVSTTNFPTAGAIVIDTEVIFYTGISGGNTFTGCTRGADSTVAATHTANTVVGADIVAFHHNGLKNEIEAVETSLVATPISTKYTIPYTSFSTAGNTNSLTLVTLPAGSIVTGCKIKHSTAFIGGSLSNYQIEVGVSGTLAAVAPLFNVHAAVSSTNYQSTISYLPTDNVATTALLVTAVSTGDTLNNATAGSVDIWIQSSQLI
jgi:hypothetical protein